MTRGWRDFQNLALAVLALTSTLLLSPSLRAQDHVVSRADLHRAMRSATEVRQENQRKVEKFFTQERVRETLKSAKIDPARVQKAVPSLSDDELARLASQTDKVQNDMAGGALTNTQITYIIIAIATALIVTLIFVA